MNIEWEKYKEFLIKKMPAYASKINIPASFEIQELEHQLNLKLPKDFIEVYSVNDGEVNLYDKSNKWGIMCGSRMFSMEQMLNYFFSEEYISKDRDKQVPIFKDVEEDYYIAMDLSPQSTESYGQIIGFGMYTQMDDVVIAPSLSAFFKSINNFIDSGYFSYSVKLEKDNEVSVHDVRMYFEHYASDLVDILMGEVF